MNLHSFSYLPRIICLHYLNFLTTYFVTIFYSTKFLKNLYPFLNVLMLINSFLYELLWKEHYLRMMMSFQSYNLILLVLEFCDYYCKQTLLNLSPIFWVGDVFFQIHLTLLLLKPFNIR